MLTRGKRMTLTKKDFTNYKIANQMEGQTEYYNNILINVRDMEYLNILKKLRQKEYKKGKIGTLNTCFDNNALQKTHIFGTPIDKFIKSDLESTSRGRCHQIVFGLSLVLDNFNWVYANLKSLALNSVFLANKRSDFDSMNWMYQISRDYDSVEPVWNHSYLEVEGEEILKKNIVSNKSISDGFKVDENKTYVVDYQFNEIMEKSLYEKIYQSEHFQKFSCDEVKQIPVWQLARSQSTLKAPENYSKYEYEQIYKKATKSANKSGEFFLNMVILSDAENFIAKNVLNMKEYVDYLRPKIESGEIKLEKSDVQYDDRGQPVEQSL